MNPNVRAAGWTALHLAAAWLIFMFPLLIMDAFGIDGANDPEFVMFAIVGALSFGGSFFVAAPWRSLLRMGVYPLVIGLGGRLDDALLAGLALVAAVAMMYVGREATERGAHAALGVVWAFLVIDAAPDAVDWALTLALLGAAVPLFLWTVMERGTPRLVGAAATAGLAALALVLGLDSSLTGFTEWSVFLAAPLLVALAVGIWRMPKVWVRPYNVPAA